MLRPKLLLAVVSIVVCCGLAAQSAQRSDDVNGMVGAVSILPNQNGTHTTLVFNSNTPLTATSSQIVFVLQADNTALPPSWSGTARVFVGDGFLGVAPDEKPGQKYLFKFSDRGVPPRLSKMGFQVFEVFGIARYGETTPLTAKQISCLATTGSNCPAS